jgi:hypothetical protein
VEVDIAYRVTFLIIRTLITQDPPAIGNFRRIPFTQKQSAYRYQIFAKAHDELAFGGSLTMPVSPKLNGEGGRGTSAPMSAE